MVTSSARSSNVCKLHFLPHVIEYIIYRFVFCRWLLHCLTHDVPLFTNLHFCHGQQTVSIFYIFAARCWNFCEIYIFAATLVVALIVHLHCSFNIFLCIYIFAVRCWIFCEIYIFAAGYYIDCAFTFLPLHLLLQLHCLYIYIFAGCFALLTNFHFCCLLLIYILPLAFALLTFFFCFANLHFAACCCIVCAFTFLSHTIVFCLNKRSIILLRPQGKNMLEQPNHPMGANIRLNLD